MAIIDEQALTLESDIKNANKIKDIVVNSLIKEGLISQNDGMDYVERFQVLIYKGSWFKRFFDKYIKNDTINIDGYFYRIVEMQVKKPMFLNDIS
jgi:hypothetical protein